MTKIPLLVGFRDLEKKSVTIGTNTLFVQREIPPFSLVTMRWPTLRVYFCATLAWFFRSVLPFGNLPFYHALTNATDNHKYSPLPSADFDIAEVSVSFSAIIFT